MKLNSFIFLLFPILVLSQNNYQVKFHTDTDTEIILNSYKIFGKECFKKFNGMWAMAIWDNETKKIILCRGVNDRRNRSWF